MLDADAHRTDVELQLDSRGSPESAELPREFGDYFFFGDQR
jgi:hypothetical protein